MLHCRYVAAIRNTEAVQYQYGYAFLIKVQSRSHRIDFRNTYLPIPDYYFHSLLIRFNLSCRCCFILSTTYANLKSTDVEYIRAYESVSHLLHVAFLPGLSHLKHWFSYVIYSWLISLFWTENHAVPLQKYRRLWLRIPYRRLQRHCSSFHRTREYDCSPGRFHLISRPVALKMYLRYFQGS